MSDAVWLTNDQQRAWRSFVAMRATLNSRLVAHLQAESGLSDADYPILVALSEAPGGKARAAELSRETGWEKSRLSHQLTRMEQKGFLRRTPCAEDSRYSDIVLTDEGRAAIEAAAPRHVAHVREWFVDAMTPEQLTEFGRICDAVLARLEASPDNPCPVAASSCP
jgi:DNA-binding MarR family transcriptional regulator